MFDDQIIIIGIFEPQTIIPDTAAEPIILAYLKSLTLYPIEFDSIDTILVHTSEYF